MNKYKVSDRDLRKRNGFIKGPAPVSYELLNKSWSCALQINHYAMKAYGGRGCIDPHFLSFLLTRNNTLMGNSLTNLYWNGCTVLTNEIKFLNDTSFWVGGQKQ
jgi:hypothetical protein